MLRHDGKAWSNAAEDWVELVDPDPAWPARFETEAAEIRATVAMPRTYRLEHFGSTSVPGIRAKPIIDILLIHPERSQWPALIDPLQSLGYVYWAENPRKDRMFFVKGMPPYGKRRTHHVHVRVPDDARAELTFRDRLRGDPAAARAYAQLKAELAAHHPNDRDAYTGGKSDFVAKLLG